MLGEERRNLLGVLVHAVARRPEPSNLHTWSSVPTDEGICAWPRTRSRLAAGTMLNSVWLDAVLAAIGATPVRKLSPPRWFKSSLIALSDGFCRLIATLDLSSQLPHLPLESLALEVAQTRMLRADG